MASTGRRLTGAKVGSMGQEQAQANEEVVARNSGKTHKLVAYAGNMESVLSAGKTRLQSND